MKKTLLIVSAVAIVASSQAVDLFNNADGRGLQGVEGLATIPRPAGGFYSELLFGNSTFGFTSAGAFSLADDFTVGANAWQVDSASLFAYQTGETVAGINGGTYEIREDNAGAPTGALAGTGTASSVAFTNIYRATAGGASGDTRRVQRVEVNFGGAVLNPNTHYWITWLMVGNPALGGPFCPVLTDVNAPSPSGSLNAQQFNAVWAPIVDAGSGTNKDLPFILQGSVVPEPGTFIAIGIGLAGLALARRRK